MTVFITGATGDLGRVLVRELVRHGVAMRLLVQRDSNRAGLELPGVEFVRGELSEPVTVRKGMTGCDAVLHLAAVGRHPGDGEAWRVALEGSQALLQAALEMRMSSVVLVNELTVLGPTRDNEALDETSISPTTPFETLVREYADKGVGVKAVYAGMGYGCVRAPGHGGLAEHTLLRLAAGKSLPVPGNGRNPLALGYFKDTVQGILLAHAQGRSGQSYILAGEAVTWPEFLEMAAEIVGQEPPRQRMPLWWMRLTAALPADVLAWAGREWRYRSDKARLELGWRPVSIQDGLAETWNDYQALGWGARAGSPLRVMRRA